MDDVLVCFDLRIKCKGDVPTIRTINISMLFDAFENFNEIVIMAAISLILCVKFRRHDNIEPLSECRYGL